MLEKSFNEIVYFTLAENPTEVDQVVAGLPAVVANGLGLALEQMGEAHRYDANGQRAYYFQRHGPGFSVWTWNDLHTYKEASELLSLIVNLEEPLNEERATDAYTRATGRSVSESRLNPREEPKST